MCKIWPIRNFDSRPPTYEHVQKPSA